MVALFLETLQPVDICRGGNLPPASPVILQGKKPSVLQISVYRTDYGRAGACSRRWKHLVIDGGSKPPPYDGCNCQTEI